MDIENALNLAIDNVILEGTTDVDLFSRPFEIDMLKNQEFRNAVVKELKPGLKAGDFNALKFLPLSHCLVPKKDFLHFENVP